MFETKNMQYRNFGNTGLMVSALSFGNAGNTEVPHQENVQIVRKCLENGINFFDTAELYWDGEAEASYGKIFKELKVARQKIVVATKIWLGPNPSINSTRSTNKKHIKESVKGSLQRLQMEYVDIIYVHSYDQSTSVEEICRTFNEVIQDGQAFYWAISNWDADTVFEAFRICERYNLHKPIGAQLQYNMFVRQQVQSEYKKLFEQYHYGLVGYNSLLGGYLTGKYLFENGQGRFTRQITGKFPKQDWIKLYKDPHDIKKVDESMHKLKDLAEKQLNCNLLHLVLAWTIKCPFMSSVLVGARNTKQLEDSLKSLEVASKMTSQLQEKINKILGTHPDPKFNGKTWTAFPHVRPIAKE